MFAFTLVSQSPTALSTMSWERSLVGAQMQAQFGEMHVFLLHVSLGLLLCFFALFSCNSSALNVRKRHNPNLHKQIISAGMLRSLRICTYAHENITECCEAALERDNRSQTLPRSLSRIHPRLALFSWAASLLRLFAELPKNMLCEGSRSFRWNQSECRHDRTLSHYASRYRHLFESFSSDLKFHHIASHRMHFSPSRSAFMHCTLHFQLQHSHSLSARADDDETLVLAFLFFLFSHRAACIFFPFKSHISRIDFVWNSLVCS